MDYEEKNSDTDKSENEHKTPDDTEKQYDKIMRVSTYLLEKYGDELWKEFGIEKTGDTMKDMFSVMLIFDEIYKIEKEKYPAMWYEYALCNG